MKTKLKGPCVQVNEPEEDAPTVNYTDCVLDPKDERDWLENRGDGFASCAEQSIQPVGLTARHLPFFGVRIRTRRFH